MDNIKGHILFVSTISYWDFWEENTGLEEPLAWASGAISYLLIPLKTSMAVMVARNRDDTAQSHFLLFPLILSSYFMFMLHTARSAEVQEGCHTLQIARAYCIGRECHREIIKACVDHPVSSVTSRAAMYSVHLQFFHYKLLSETFLCGAGTLWERPKSMLFFLTRGRGKMAFRQFIKFHLDHRTLLWYCAKLQCQLSVRCQKII